MMQFPCFSFIDELENSEVLAIFTLEVLVLTRFAEALVAQMVQNQLAIQETWIQSLDQDDPLEKGMATHSSILVWGILWTEESGRLQSTGLQ